MGVNASYRSLSLSLPNHPKTTRPAPGKTSNNTRSPKNTVTYKRVSEMEEKLMSWPNGKETSSKCSYRSGHLKRSGSEHQEKSYSFPIRSALLPFCIKLHLDKLLSQVEAREQMDILSWRLRGRSFIPTTRKSLLRSLISSAFRRSPSLPPSNFNLISTDLIPIQTRERTITSGFSAASPSFVVAFFASRSRATN